VVKGICRVISYQQGWCHYVDVAQIGEASAKVQDRIGASWHLDRTGATDV